MTTAESAADSSSFPGPLEKYHYKPFFGSSHHWAISEALRLPTSSRVLDIGAGSGPLGRALSEAGFKNLAAVEIDARARDALRAHYARVEPEVAPFASERFELVLILDVLEHLAEPQAMLRTATSMLAPGGTILLSVPNVAHWSVRIPLLFGSFRYTERGILDKTHLQFFTRSRLASMLAAETDLKGAAFFGSIPPAEFVLPKAVWDNPVWRGFAKAHHGAAQFLPGLFAYQLLAKAEKR